MYERFTDRARKVMQLAAREAQRFDHSVIDTGHVLLGLLNEGSGVASFVLKDLGVNVDGLRLMVEHRFKGGKGYVLGGNIPQTAHCRRAIEYAIDAADKLGHDWIGTEHILLGLLRQEDTLAYHCLRDGGLSTEKVRDSTLRLLGLLTTEDDLLANAEKFMEQARVCSNNEIGLRVASAVDAIIGFLKSREMPKFVIPPGGIPLHPDVLSVKDGIPVDERQFCNTTLGQPYEPTRQPESPGNNYKPWPTDWPPYFHRNEPCDMLVGPCGCGTHHTEGEFTLEQDGLRDSYVARNIYRWPSDHTGGDKYSAQCSCAVCRDLRVSASLRTDFQRQAKRKPEIDRASELRGREFRKMMGD